MNRNKIVVILILLGLLFLELVSCKQSGSIPATLTAPSSGEKVPFVILSTDDGGCEVLVMADGSHSPTRCEDVSEPFIRIISNQTEVDASSGVISLSTLQKLQAIDFDNNVALIVHQGKQPTSGYSVEVQNLTQEKNTIKIYALFKRPAAETPVTEIVTYPYQVVQVPRVNDSIDDYQFMVVVNDKIVAQYP